MSALKSWSIRSLSNLIIWRITWYVVVFIKIETNSSDWDLLNLINSGRMLPVVSATNALLCTMNTESIYSTVIWFSSYDNHICLIQCIKTIDDDIIRVRTYLNVMATAEKIWFFRSFTKWLLCLLPSGVFCEFYNFRTKCVILEVTDWMKYFASFSFLFLSFSGF